MSRADAVRGQDNEESLKPDKSLLRAIPKVDELLGWLEQAARDKDESGTPQLAMLVENAPTLLIKNLVRKLLQEYRELILAGKPVSAKDLSRESVLEEISERLARQLEPAFRPLINATGVIIHTNLGRSLLPDVATKQLMAVGGAYSNLEFSLDSGKRGSRYSLVSGLLKELTGAEAALVVNNNAAAVLLILQTLAAGREVIVSRGQLVEIGGSFRIPDVMTRSGAKLVEVGATNRTHLTDYEQAISQDTALLLKVHTSNYRVLGFSSEVATTDLVELGRRKDLPVVEDLGSGSFIDLAPFGLGHEPTVQEALRSGVDIVCFSGDKLLGGPQAGIILGKAELVQKLAKNPLNRALRIDKFTLAALEQVLRLYYDPERVIKELPTLRMLTQASAEIKKRAQRMKRALRDLPSEQCGLELVKTVSRVGGGALPESQMPSYAIALTPRLISLNQLEKQLRAARLPVIARVENDRFIMDMRTVADKEIPLLAAAVRKVLS